MSKSSTSIPSRSFACCYPYTWTSRRKVAFVPSWRLPRTGLDGSRRVSKPGSSLSSLEAVMFGSTCSCRHGSRRRPWDNDAHLGMLIIQTIRFGCLFEPGGQMPIPRLRPSLQSTASPARLSPATRRPSCRSSADGHRRRHLLTSRSVVIFTNCLTCRSSRQAAWDSRSSSGWPSTSHR